MGKSRQRTYVTCHCNIDSVYAYVFVFVYVYICTYTHLCLLVYNYIFIYGHMTSSLCYVDKPIFSVALEDKLNWNNFIT